MVIIKIIDGGTYSTLIVKLKFTCNRAILDVKNKEKDTMILRPEEMIGIIDLRSPRYYKIKQKTKKKQTKKPKTTSDNKISHKMNIKCDNYISHKK